MAPDKKAAQPIDPDVRMGHVHLKVAVITITLP